MRIHVVLIVLLLAAMAAKAQQASPRATGTVFVDLFGGPQGATIYPQYAWGINTRTVRCSGYGFGEVAPHEPFFVNNLGVCGASKFPQFSVHTETGGIPRRGLGFFQVGPRVNMHEVFPQLKKPLHYLFVAALPQLVGHIRTNNLLIAGATNRRTIGRGVSVSFEGYRRIFAGGRPDYSEYWGLVHTSRFKKVSFAAFVIQDGSKLQPLNGGIRYTP